MSHLIKYEAACRAIAECKAIDEVKSWHDKAAAMQAYGRMAKDKTLETNAAEIRIRAERRLGEMIAQQKEDGGLSQGGRPSETGRDDRPVSEKPTLADAGISKDLSSRAQKLAAVPEAEFEAEVGEWRERVSAENARVTTRLELAGDRAQKKAKAEVVPDPEAPISAAIPPGMVMIAEDELEGLRSALAELQSNLADTLADNESMARVFESDDKIGAALAEAKRYREQARIADARIASLMNEKNAAIRSANSFKNKLDRIERDAKKAANDGIDPAVGF